MSWPERKLSGEPEAVAEHAVRDVGDVDETTVVLAPCCHQREVPADMVVWVPGEGYRCDACRRRLERDPSTEWTRPKLMRAMGAPASEVRAERAKEIARERIHEVSGRGETIVRAEIHRQAREELPEDGMPPGTDLPEHARQALNNRPE